MEGEGEAPLRSTLLPAAFCVLACLAFGPDSLASGTTAPPNDDCSSATVVEPGSYGGTTCGAHRETSSSCDTGWTAPDVWYSYTAPADGLLALDTFGSNFDTAVSVHTSCPATPGTDIACNDDCGQAGSCLSFAVQAQHTYWIRVTGFHGETGAFRLRLSAPASISGRITDASSGTRLAGVNVYLYLTDGTYIANTFSDSTGLYRFPGLTPGSYILRSINSDGYVDELYDNHTCEGLGCTPDPADPVILDAGEDRTGIDFALDKGGSITGIVTDAATGAPLSGAEVHIHDAGNTHITLGFADATGRYTSYDGLITGDYLVLAMVNRDYIDQLHDGIPCPNSHCNPDSGLHVPVTLGLPSTVDFAVQPAGKIAGTMSDSVTGLPLSGIQINVYDPLGSRITGGTSDATGAYIEFDGLPDGQYFLRTSNGKGYVDELYPDIPCMAGLCSVTLGTPIEVTTGQSTPGIDFSLDPGGRILGTVTDPSGRSLPAVVLDLHDAVNRHIRYEYTDFNGAYSSYYGLETGQYFLRTLNFDGFFDELYDNLPCPSSNCDITLGTPIEVTKGQSTSNVNFVLERGGVVSGKVIDSATGLPLGNVAVGVFDSNGFFWTQGVSDSCGNYSVYNGLDTGTYFARTANQGGYIDEYYDDLPCILGNCSLGEATPIPVEYGQNTSSVDFALSRLLLLDNFQDETLSWRVRSGSWIEQNGVLTGSPPETGKARLLDPVPWLPSGEQSCRNCTIQADLEMMAGGKVSIQGWYRDASNRVELMIDEAKGQWRLKQISGGKLLLRTRKTHAVPPGTPFQVRLSFDGTSFRAYADHQLVLSARSVLLPEGGLRLDVRLAPATFDNIAVY
jgi:protocatechuate 3,4-dioxygenase beta subunit